MVCLSMTDANGADGTGDATETYRQVETYKQVLVIKRATGTDDLQPPQLSKVYNGHNWALSTRWDDSNANALNVRRKMLENGIRGTFYLNSRKPEKTPATSLACKLTGAGECSVGGHSVSHPKLPELPANDAFRELMANRITLEVLTDRPVNSLAFPYGAYQAKDRPEVLEAITKAVLRTGYHHCVYKNFVTRNPNLPKGLISTGHQVDPGDRQVNAEKFWASINKIRKFQKGYRKESDCIFLGVHPWQKGDALEDLANVMSDLRNWDDFWHCTHTEYAAFVKQRNYTTVTKTGTDTFTIERPGAYDLGNDIALTLEFEGEGIATATVDGIVCPMRKAEGKTFLNISHAARQGLPETIDEATAGKSPAFPGLDTALTFDTETGQVVYTLSNSAAAPLTDAVLTVSLPPSFEPGFFRQTRPDLKKGATWSATIPLADEQAGDYWRKGNRYIAAQLDFILDGKRGRLFTTSTVSPQLAAR